MWDRVDEGAGESHAKPALAIDGRNGMCVCRACEASWPTEHWELLVKVLEQQKVETLAAAGLDPTHALRLQRKVIELQLATGDLGPADASLERYAAVP